MAVNKKVIPFIILTLIILLQGYMLIFRDRGIDVEPFDDSALLEKIKLADSAVVYWQSIALSWEQVATDAENYSDSLENIKPIIKHHYHEIYRDIADGTIVELDSIVRATW